MGDLPSVYRYESVKARKSHKCCECQREIRPGDRYELCTGCWDGKWSAFKTCMPCAGLRSDLLREWCNLFDDEGIEFGGLREWAREAEVEFPPAQEAK
jgi:hypothetical protein